MRISDWSADVCSSDLIADGIGVDLRGYYAHSRIDLDGYASTPPYAFTGTSDRSTTQELYGYAGVHANIGRFRNRGAVTIADVNRDNYRSEEHTSALQSLMRISYAVFCLKKKKTNQTNN